MTFAIRSMMLCREISNLMVQQAIQLLSEFECLGNDCEDTCCKGWNMQLDEPHKQLYEKEKPELLEAVDDFDGMPIMKRDEKTDFCVKFDDGLCGIHKTLGEKFLGDACFFFPRSVRQYGTQDVMSAAFSCPQVVRLAEKNSQAFKLQEASYDRVPHSVKNYLPEGMPESDALAVMEAFRAHFADENLPPEVSLMMACSVARSMKNLPADQWPVAVPFYLRTALDRMTLPQAAPANVYRLVHMLYIIMMAMPQVQRPRLQQTLDEMLKALNATIDPATHMIQANGGDFSAYESLKSHWENGPQADLAPLVRNWLQGQVWLHGLPFAGMGDDAHERLNFLAVRFAITRLAVMAAMQQSDEKDAHIRAIQTIARVMDHLASPEMLRQIAGDAGWLQEEGLMGLIAG
jgi:hypothetical protein